MKTDESSIRSPLLQTLKHHEEKPLRLNPKNLSPSQKASSMKSRRRQTMPSVTFPAKRFLEAGATAAEVEQLEGEFERSDRFAKDSMVTNYAGHSEAGLRDHIAQLREAEHFSTHEGLKEQAEASEDAVKDARTPEPKVVRPKAQISETPSDEE
jgi:hypothetical protein